MSIGIIMKGFMDHWAISHQFNIECSVREKVVLKMVDNPTYEITPLSNHISYV